MDTPIYRTAIAILIVILLGGCTWKQRQHSAQPEPAKPVLSGEYFMTHHLMTDQGMIRTSLAEAAYLLIRIARTLDGLSC